MNRNTLWEILKKLQYPDMFISVLRGFREEMKVRVSIEVGKLSDPILAENGVKC